MGNHAKRTKEKRERVRKEDQHQAYREWRTQVVEEEANKTKTNKNGGKRK